MASVKLLRDEKTGNVYECILNDKGEIIQEYFIPASEISKHPKFTAPLDVKSRFKYLIPSSQTLTNKTLGSNSKIVKNVKNYRDDALDAYKTIITYEDGTFQEYYDFDRDLLSYSNFSDLLLERPHLNHVIKNINTQDFASVIINSQNNTKKFFNNKKKENFTKIINYNILMYFPIVSLIVYLLFLAIENI